MGISHERRVHPRARVKVRVEVRQSGRPRPLLFHTEDLSEGGARCVGLSEVAPGATIEGHMFLPLSEAGRAVDVPLPFEARVVRTRGTAGVSGTEIALCFTRIAEADRDELRRFLLDWMADDCLSHACLVGVQ
jgi:c-di-GMP-binding flagellar brake protein YcgR